MRLFAFPFACSLAAHIALREAKLPHDIHWVRRRSGADDVDPALAQVSSKGKVAALVLDDGSVLTENIAVLLYIAERTAPVEDRYRLCEALSFVATEIHKQVLNPFFDPVTPEPVRAYACSRLPSILAYPEELLARRPYLLGEQPSVADAYLLWSLLLAPRLGVDLAAFPALAEYRRRLLQREACATAIALERELLTTTLAARSLP